MKNGFTCLLNQINSYATVSFDGVPVLSNGCHAANIESLSFIIFVVIVLFNSCFVYHIGHSIKRLIDHFQ